MLIQRQNQKKIPRKRKFFQPLQKHLRRREREKNLHQKLLKRLRSNLVVMMFHLRQRKNLHAQVPERKNPPLQKVQMKHKMM